ncbi:MAG: 50S ribosomal protein L23 [Chrysiogenales bacterium]|jgi:large subunit ribosomal protein L23|nr:50S ribosomal protein L23 [Acidobacteriota bacterium]MCG2810598.1 50S ribosomal protein L23 [Candidatus Aminicenantes bacterium]TFG77633.1 MAG: 50S ribosomal protein L23 [Chrysiogenales bacterium]HUU04986.1 50S ribosomal protein L23 [Patescibacteria group bacterium]
MKLEYAEMILAPLVTEKSTALKDKQRLLCFKVHRDANKIMVKKAVEELFKTKVEWVRILNFQGKEKRHGRYVGRRADWKKAYVKLSPDVKMIEYIEVI